MCLKLKFLWINLLWTIAKHAKKAKYENSRSTQIYPKFIIYSTQKIRSQNCAVINVCRSTLNVFGSKYTP